MGKGKLKMNMTVETKLGDRQGCETLLGAIFRSAYLNDKKWIEKSFLEIVENPKWLKDNELWLKRQLCSALLDEMDCYPIPAAEARKVKQNILNELIIKHQREKQRKICK